VIFSDDIFCLTRTSAHALLLPALFLKKFWYLHFQDINTPSIILTYWIVCNKRTLICNTFGSYSILIWTWCG